MHGTVNVINAFAWEGLSKHQIFKIEIQYFLSLTKLHRVIINYEPRSTTAFL